MTDDLIKLLEESADILDEVRTGEDFECKCSEQAEKLRVFIRDQQAKDKIKLALKVS